jgi:hypothetical protein
VGLLSDVDSVRFEVRLFDKGNVLSDYAHQSFAVAGEGAKMTMRPGFYLDKKTGTLLKGEPIVQGLSTSCLSCHRSGPRMLTEEQSDTEVAEQNRKNIAAFVDQAKHWGAPQSFRRDLESLMTEKGPPALLPLADMLRANRETWVALYPKYLELPKPRPANKPRVDSNRALLKSRNVIKS